ncbi:MAG: hypothetical protein M9924_08535 [Rhizobiaceae bacterium]|nr:hypothetical protein [Rhizobiaceae bacterium]
MCLQKLLRGIGEAPTRSEPPASDIRNYQVGALTILIGNNLTQSPVWGRAGRVSFALSDWAMVYRPQIDRADGWHDPAVLRLLPANCNAGNWDFEGEAMLVIFPRAMFKGLEHPMEAICAGRAAFPASPLLQAYCESLWHNLPLIKESEKQVVEAVTRQLVKSCIARVKGLDGSEPRPANRTKLEAARRYIDDRISSPSLTVENVQSCLGISRRQLYSLFEPYGGVARYIQSQRLRKCHSAIADPQDTRPVARIAEFYGLDPTRIARLFREEFGYDPNDARLRVRQSRPGNVPILEPEARVA